MEINEIIANIKKNISESIVGNSDVTDLLLISLFCSGHVLIEDVPGTGKTMTVKALAHAVGCAFGRIQFTPDLLPSDITGINFFNVKKSEFEFLPGPVFANILLADEINRATPKTQAGLLECMEERQATVDGVTYELPSPFMVIATQNPVESMGTFPLPEAQLDRFTVKLTPGYPDEEGECEILKRYEYSGNVKSSGPAATAEDVKKCADALSRVYVDEDLYKYAVSICRATRNAPGVILGASPRASIALLRVAKGYALLDGRGYCVPDDVIKAAVPVLAHRLILSNSERIRKDASGEIIRNIVTRIHVPTERVFDGVSKPI